MADNLNKKIKLLQAEIRELRKENLKLKQSSTVPDSKPKVSAPENFKPVFEQAESIVGEYFKNLKFSPSEGTIEINDQRYVLVRASALSYEFLNSFVQLYSNRGEDEAIGIAKNILFDLAHLIGMEDAKNFHKKMKLKDPISKLSAGPVHFAYSGWAFVDILPESKPSPDENYFLKYNNPFSFEADSWLRAGKKSKTTVCIMNFLTVPATEAADMLDGVKVALLDPADRPTVLAARRAEVAALMGRQRPMASPGSPWMPVIH